MLMLRLSNMQIGSSIKKKIYIKKVQHCIINRIWLLNNYLYNIKHMYCMCSCYVVS